MADGSALAFRPDAAVAGCAAVDAAALTAAAAHLAPGTVALVPKLDLRQQADLTTVLLAMGLTSLGAGGDFSGISPSPLGLGAVEHQTVMRVDEKGTVAAAASASLVVTSGFAGIPVVLDRPFAVELQDRSTGAPLFLGWVADPSRR